VSGLEPFDAEVEIGLFTGWHHIDPRCVEDVNEVMRSILERSDATTEDPDWFHAARLDVNVLVRMVTDTFSALPEANVAMYAWWIDLARDDKGVTALMAHATLTVARIPIAVTRDEEILALSVLARDHGGDPFDERLPECDLVNLTGGTALRVRRSIDVPMPGDVSPMNQAIVQYILPVVDAPSVAVLTFATPSVQYADQLQPMFDSIASTLEVTPRATIPHGTE
jgi:hypothetical protein